MFTLLTAAGAAAAMYFFDPESGGRRRALLRDKFSWLRDEFGDIREAADGKIEHMGNVSKGLAHESGMTSMTPKQPELGAQLNASSMSQTHEDDSRDDNRNTSRAA
jgi:hypothetical protein